MRFYYFSLFSWMLYLVVALGAIGLVTLIWTGLLKLRFASPIYWVLVPAILVLPWAEELWIAYNFDRLCHKDAGVFVNKVVKVDGFYDDTTHWWRQLKESDYRFVESRDNIHNTLWRVEKVGNDIRHFKIGRPTARYHYSAPYRNDPVHYKIRKTERIVKDSETGEVLGRETKYGRDAYWFFVSLDRPVMLCPGPGENSLEARGLVYKQTLQPRVTR